MFVPSQGFRHAATLLLSNGARAIPADAPPETTHVLLERLAHELLLLADDMRVTAAAAEWLAAELNATIDRLPQSLDRDAAKSAGAAILARMATHARQIAAHDLFLIYAPHDRLPLAAPLAVELAKRRVSVAFAGYEVATADEFIAAMTHGLAHHRGGLVLWTSAFERGQHTAPPENDRVRILRQNDLLSIVPDLVEWARALRISRRQ
jgi:hypothetical protein